MSDQELLDRISQGDQAALTELCDGHAELIRKRAQWITRQYNCLRPSNRGGWSDYTKETLSELESVGMLALIECARNGGYDSTKGTFGTYIVPFMDGAMRRHLESSMGTLSLDRDSMGLVRKAQMLYHRDGKEISFVTGMATMALLIAVVIPASASWNEISYNQVGVRLFGEQVVVVGECYTAPNGQEVPSSITFTDTMGGKTNYFSVRQICELLDAAVGWNDAANSVDIAAPNIGKIGEDVIVKSGKAEERAEDILKPEYGKIIGGIEEINPSDVAVINNPEYRTRNFARDMKVQFLDSDFPGLTMDCLAYAGPYVVFSVTNNGPRTVYSEVRRFVTISSGQHEDFTSVAIPSGETLTRVFRILNDAHPLQTTLEFDVDAPADLSSVENNITISLLQYDDELS